MAHSPGTPPPREALSVSGHARFHGLRVLGHAMYVPEIHSNGAETRIEVRDARPDPNQRLRRAIVGGR